MIKRPGKQQRTKRILCLVAGFIVLFFILPLLAVKIVYDQQFPRFDRHDDTISTSLRYEDLAARYPRRLVNFPSGPNRLQGYIYGLDNERGLVVVAHGLGDGADSYLPEIAYFVDQGWRVFAYDATGSFDSEGESTRGFPQAVLDLDAALAYINGQPELAGLPLLLFGHSWGGYAVVNVLHYNHEIAGVASVAGVNSAMDIVMEQGRQLLGGFSSLLYPHLWLYQWILFDEAASFNAVEAINRSGVPVFIVHGLEDDVVLYEGSSIIARLGQMTNPRVKVLLLDKPGHSGHNNIFLSERALAYNEAIGELYRELLEEYGHDIPYAVKQEFFSKVDRDLAQEINRELMDEIHAFFLECLKDWNHDH
jgi:alpha-beta hydrolase superfamily lysophospholipase